MVHASAALNSLIGVAVANLRRTTEIVARDLLACAVLCGSFEQDDLCILRKLEGRHLIVYLYTERIKSSEEWIILQERCPRAVLPTTAPSKFSRADTFSLFLERIHPIKQVGESLALIFRRERRTHRKPTHAQNSLISHRLILILLALIRIHFP